MNTAYERRVEANTLAEPVHDGERVFTLDVLRGFALFGVLLVNFEYWFRTTPLRAEERGSPLSPGLANQVVEALLSVLFDGRFMGLFSLLFGVGLAVQAERAEMRGIRFGPFLLRRMSILFGLGVLHVLLLWWGDILHTYAVVGGLLFLVLLKRQPKTIAIVSGALLALPIVIGSAVVTILYVYSGPPARPPKDPELIAKIDVAVRTFQRGSFVEIARARFAQFAENAPLQPRDILYAFTMASIGVLAWKAGVLKRPSEHRRMLRWIAGIGALFGLGHSALYFALELVKAQRGPFLLQRLVFFWISAAMASAVLAYAACILLLLERPFMERLLRPLAAVGRMALTSYLSQSVIGSLIFFSFGLGLYDRLSSAAVAMVVVAVYASQILVSNLWLRWFRFGPVEWLWRSLTYGRAQPMRVR